MADEIVADVEYRNIPGFPNYRVGSDGSVWSCLKIGPMRRKYPSDTWKQLKQCPRDGYMTVSLYHNGRLHVPAVHRLVLEAFVGPCPEGMEACHSPNPERSCNHLSNLRWDTKKENGQDRIRHGTQLRGEKIPWHKLSQKDAEDIRTAYANGARSIDLAERYGIAKENIIGIVKGKTWKCAGGPIVTVKNIALRLSDDDVREIRRRHPSEGSRQLAKAFNCSEDMIRCIMSGKRRANVA